jgi:hypothetical protein
MNRTYFVAIVFFLHFKLDLLACSTHIDGPEKHLQKSALKPRKYRKRSKYISSLNMIKKNTTKNMNK